MLWTWGRREVFFKPEAEIRPFRKSNPWPPECRWTAGTNWPTSFRIRSSWFLTIRSMEYVWGSNGHRHGFCMIRHDVGFHSKHRNGHGQQHKRWGTYLYSYTIWTRTLNVGISDKYTWTLSRIEYDHITWYYIVWNKEKLKSWVLIGRTWHPYLNGSLWTAGQHTAVPSSPTACSSSSSSSRTTITVALGGTVYLCWYNSQTLKLSPWFTGYCTYNVAIFVILRMIFSFKDLPVR